jgi:single-strand DNA-binding protein
MNSVCIVGNLTRDPELRHTPSGAAVANLGVAVNDRRKINDEWQDVPYFFDVTVWGNAADNCAQYLVKGNKVGIQGKLTWRQWEAQDGSKRSKVEIEALPGGVTFLTPKNGSGGAYTPPGEPAGADHAPDFAGGTDDDIPF